LEQERLIYREEVTAIMGVLADINVSVQRIADAVVEDEDGEEEDEADG
jgi:hypothetical protein